MKNNLRQLGFTLLETLIAVFVFSIAVIMVNAFVSRGFQASTFGQEQNEAIENARKGIETMIEEIRESGQSNEGGYLILENNEQSLRFYSDVDRDGALEQIHYWLDGTDFKKGVIKPNELGQYLEANETSTTLSFYVRNNEVPIFTYYNADYPSDTTNNPLAYEIIYIDDIRLVGVHLEINVDPNKAPRSFTLESKAQIRTLKDNL